MKPNVTRRDRRTVALIAGLSALFVVAVVFSPVQELSDEQPRLSTFSYSPNGARGFHDASARLGWKVSRHVDTDLPPSNSGEVYALLAPSIPLTGRETHEILQRVREGAGLLVVLTGRSALSDSLAVRRAERSGRVPDDPEARCAPSRRTRALEALRGPVLVNALDFRQTSHTKPEIFLELDGAPPDPVRVAAAGYELGAGRVGVLSHPLLLTNGVVRSCRLQAGVRALQLLRYVSTDSTGAFVRERVIFDEYHHGFGSHPSITRVALRFLTQHPFGRSLAQASLAGIVLIAVVGLRPAEPPPRLRHYRRSPLEHVRALALAYSQVAATRTATRLLVRGLRRRLRRAAVQGGAPNPHDEDFLLELGTRYPEITSDVERVIRALRTPPRRKELVEVGRSVATIERTIGSART